MPEAMARIPLFPLNTVLFPGMPLPLRIFEERYKHMINRCIDAREAFGVVLIRSGVEVGGAADPHEIGTSARITHVQRLDSGRLNLIAIGERRFRVDLLDYDSEPYLVGDVTFVESTDAEIAEEPARGVADLFQEQYRLAMAISGQWARSIDAPGEPDALADFVAHHAELPALTKQDLLETLSVAERLRKEAALLDQRVAALTVKWDERRRERFAGVVLN